MSVYLVDAQMIAVGGSSLEENWRSLLATARGDRSRTSSLSPEVETKLRHFQSKKPWLKTDRGVALGGLTAEFLLVKKGFPKDAAVIVASSRGATHLWEQEHQSFLKTQKISLRTSPESTSGVFASKISQVFQLSGPSFFVSATCAGGLQALGLAYSLIQAGTVNDVLVGAVETPLTPFTYKQMGELGVLSSQGYCQPMSHQRGGMFLTEGAAFLHLSKFKSFTSSALGRAFKIVAWGASVETSSATGPSANGTGLSLAIERALEQGKWRRDDLDLLIGHGTGTLKGDQAEAAAYHRVFGPRLGNLSLSFHKWFYGHPFAASGLISLLMGCQQMRHGVLPGHPYVSDAHVQNLLPLKRHTAPLAPVHKAAICAMGFGGTSVCILMEMENFLS